MTRYQQGSTEAFQAIFSRYQSRLFRFISAKAGSSKAHLSEEVFQKVWLNLHLHRQSFDPTKKFSTWIYAIALNALRDEVGRSHEKIKFEELDEQIPNDSNNQAHDLLENSELNEILSKALGRISEKQKEIVLLIHVEGFTSQEAAALMEISHDAARQLLVRAHKALRGILAEEKP